jgi:hypothetical protein
LLVRQDHARPQFRPPSQGQMSGPQDQRPKAAQVADLRPREW